MFVNRTQWGSFRLFSIETGLFRLDGGAMFGVVPKTLWSRQIEPNALNRIPMAMRCLLVESEESGRRYLIDTGTGPKFDEKMRAIYEYDDTQYSMEASLAAHGFSTADITDIIFTHLHFDHCGGASTWDEHRKNPVPVFENAKYWVNRRHWETAMAPNAREKASFLKENLAPINDPERLILVDDNHTWENGLHCMVMDGHTQGQQLPVIKNAAGDKLVFVADLLPTSAHVPLPWVMGYDMNPLQTLIEKERFMKEAAQNQWTLFLEHDAHHQLMRISEQNGKYAAIDLHTFDDLEG